MARPPVRDPERRPAERRSTASRPAGHVAWSAARKRRGTGRVDDHQRGESTITESAAARAQVVLALERLAVDELDDGDRAVVRAALGQDVELVEREQRAGDAQDRRQRERRPQQRQRDPAEGLPAAGAVHARAASYISLGMACRPDQQEQHVEAGVPPDDQEQRRQQRAAASRGTGSGRRSGPAARASGLIGPIVRRVEALEEQRRRRETRARSGAGRRAQEARSSGRLLHQQGEAEAQPDQQDRGQDRVLDRERRPPARTAVVRGDVKLVGKLSPCRR